MDQVTSLDEQLKDLESFFEKVLAQRQNARMKAAESIKNNEPMPPEMRISEISTYRRCTIDFTNQMDFPGTAEFIEQNDESELSLLSVSMISGDNESVDQNLSSWTITEVTSEKIEIELQFDSPLAVSQGDTPDKIAI